MSYSEELFAPRNDTSRPDFELALRGYDKRQVDHYVSQVDRDMTALRSAQKRSQDRAQALAHQLEQTQVELNELRQQPPRLEKASFRDLGPTVDQIMALAEKQAAEITDAAGQRAADQVAEAEKVLADARQRADWLRADAEAAHEQSQQEAKRLGEQSVQHLEEARAEAEELVANAREQARQEVEAARAQTQQEVQARKQVLGQLHAELDTAQQQLTQARHEGATAEREYAQLQQRISEANQELAAELERLDRARQDAEATERHAKEVRARVQREAERVAQLAAAAVMAAAARGAETGEYPMVVAGQPAAGPPTAGQSTPAQSTAAQPAVSQPSADDRAPNGSAAAAALEPHSVAALPVPPVSTEDAGQQHADHHSDHDPDLDPDHGARHDSGLSTTVAGPGHDDDTDGAGWPSPLAAGASQPSAGSGFSAFEPRRPVSDAGHSVPMER